MDAVSPRVRKRGIGCLPGLLIFALLIPLFVATIDLIFAPWIYCVGGRTRLLPLWAGEGVAQTPSGPYTLHIWFSPTPSGSRVLASTSVRGSGYLCTHTFSVRGGASGRIWNDMEGHAFSLNTYNQPFFSRLQGDWRPKLNFSGAWVGADLKMSDQGTLAQAFLADGSLSVNPRGARKEDAVPITLTETRWWWVAGSCGKA